MRIVKEALFLSPFIGGGAGDRIGLHRRFQRTSIPMGRGALKETFSGWGAVADYGRTFGSTSQTKQELANYAR